MTPVSSLARSSASPFSLASLRRCACRSCSTIFLLDSVAATASRLGSRKLRAYPGGDLHDLAAAAQFVDIFSENDFHVDFLLLRTTPRTAAARCCAPS